MHQPDQLHRYLFTLRDIRGELVTVSDTWQQMLNNHNYPKPVRMLLGEMLVVTSLLTATLKFAGTITVQLQGDGALTLLVINGDHQQHMRGVARVTDEIADDATLKTLVGNGVMVITIAPNNGERYQGVVALESDNLASCLEGYFQRSEQLKTRLFIRTGEMEGQLMAAGMLLQALPAQQISDDANGDTIDDAIDYLATLTQTITVRELCSLPAQEVLWRLYHEESVTLYSPQAVTFKCGCSRQRCAEVLATLSRQEIDSMLADKEQIDMHCDYCGQHYWFTPAQWITLRQAASEVVKP